MERRQHPRHSYTCAITAGQAPTGDDHGVTGRIVDLSERGAGVLVDESVERSTLMMWKLHVNGAPVPVPVLGQVRWVSAAGGGRFRMGVLFVG